MSKPSPQLPFDLPPRPSSSSSSRCAPIVSISPIIASAETIKMHSQTTLTTSSDLSSIHSTPPPLPSRTIASSEQNLDETGSTAFGKIQTIAREHRSKLVEINLAQKTSAMANVARSKGFEFKDRAYEKGTEWTKFGREAFEKWKTRNSQGIYKLYILDGSRCIDFESLYFLESQRNRLSGLYSKNNGAFTVTFLEDLRSGIAGRRLSEGPIFGQPLEIAVQRSEIDEDCPVPAVVIRCIEYLDCNGLNEVGLYRVPGSTSAVTRLKAIFDEGNDMDLLDSNEDPNAAATLLKMYLRELPDPIIPKELLPEFNACLPRNAGLSPEQRLKQMENVPEKLAMVAERLPEPNYYLLHWLMSHLARLDFYSTENKMTVSNLGLIFCPTLLISSVLFTAFVNHVGVVFPLPRKPPPSTAYDAPSSSASVSRNSKRNSGRFALNRSTQTSPNRTAFFQSGASPNSSKRSQAPQVDSNSSTAVRNDLMPTESLVGLNSTESRTKDQPRDSLDNGKGAGGVSTEENTPTVSRTSTSGSSGKGDSGLIGIDIDGNGLHMGVLNLNIRRSPAARGGNLPNTHSPVVNSNIPNVNETLTSSTLQSPSLPPRPARLTRKLTPRTTTKYVKDILELVEH